MDQLELLGLRLRPVILRGLFVVNIVLLVYRLVAVVDAWRVARYLNADRRVGGDGRSARPRCRGAVVRSRACGGHRS